MASDPTGAGSLLGKLYFVLLHFLFFLMGFYIIKIKAKYLENGENHKESKKERPDRSISIYTTLNAYLKSSYPFSKSSLRIIVDQWLTAIEHDVKKELKRQSNEKLVSSIKIERSDEVPFKLENVKQHWKSNDDELVLEVVVQTKSLKFKVVNKNKEISYFVLPPVHLKAMTYVEIGDRTILRYVEIKAQKEIKLSLAVEGKHKQICNYIAQALNVVLMKPKKVTAENLEIPKSKKKIQPHEEQHGKEDISVRESDKIDVTNDTSVNTTKPYDKEDEEEFIHQWSAASPRIDTHQQKSKSLSRLDSIPRYIERERALQQRSLSTAQSHNAVDIPPDVQSTPLSLKRQPSDTLRSDTSSVLFEPISPLSRQSDSNFSPVNGHDDSSFFPSFERIPDDETGSIDYQPVRPKRTSTSKMTPLEGFQAMYDSLDQTFNSSGADLPSPTGYSPNEPPEVPKRTKKGANGLTTANSNSPKIQNAIEPKFTTADSAQTIKTPILKSKETPGRRQPSQLTKNNLLRHSFHHGTRPSFDYAQSLGSLSNRSESPTPIRSATSHNILNSAIGYIPNTSSALVIEVMERGGVKHYRIPPNMARKENYPFKGQKLHVYNEHIFVATHFTGTMPSCSVCSLPLRRLGKQGYSCRDCKVIVHKRCHCRIVEACPMTSLPNMEIDYIGATDV